MVMIPAETLLMIEQEERDRREAGKAALKAITRFEVIDETGRAYVKYGVEIELSYQDDGRTLKVFVKPRDKADK